MVSRNLLYNSNESVFLYPHFYILRLGIPQVDTILPGSGSDNFTRIIPVRQ
jgi:hypothetical protein